MLAGGPRGGRHILADSNLDWGQGLEALARLQRERPEFRDMTFYYFGDTDPAHYGVAGRCHVINAVDDQSRLPGLDRVETPYLAVSASLQFGPWGPPGFFRDLDRLEPVRLTDDTTIAIYRTADLRDDLAAHRSVNVPAAREPVLEPVGQLGHAPDQPLGIDRLDRVDREVFDHDEVLFAAQHAHREVPVDDARVELEQGAAVAVVDRPADRDEPHDGTPLGIGPGRPDVDRLLAIEPQRNDELPAAGEGVGFVTRSLHEFDDQPRHVGIGGLGASRTARARRYPPRRPACNDPIGRPQAAQYRSET